MAWAQPSAYSTLQKTPRMLKASSLLEKAEAGSQGLRKAGVSLGGFWRCPCAQGTMKGLKKSFSEQFGFECE